MALKLLCDLNKHVPSSEPFLSGIGQGYMIKFCKQPIRFCYSISHENMRSIILSIPYFDFTICICIPFRSGIKKVIQLLLQLRSVDKARLVAVEHNMDELCERPLTIPEVISCLKQRYAKKPSAVYRPMMVFGILFPRISFISISCFPF